MVEIFIKLTWPVVEDKRRALRFKVGVNNAGEIIETKLCDSKREVLKEIDRLIFDLVNEEIKSFPNSFPAFEREKLLT